MTADTVDVGVETKGRRYTTSSSPAEVCNVLRISPGTEGTSVMSCTRCPGYMRCRCTRKKTAKYKTWRMVAPERKAINLVMAPDSRRLLGMGSSVIRNNVTFPELMFTSGQRLAS